MAMLTIGIVFILFLSACSASKHDATEYKYFSNDENPEEIVIFDFPKDGELHIDMAKGSTIDQFIVKDSSDQPVDVVKKTDGQKLLISAPKGGYSKGETYTIDIHSKGSFSGPEFKGVSELTFIVECEEKEIVEFKDSVIEIESSSGTVFTGESITIPGEYSDGQIIIVDTDEDGVKEPYKLVNTSSNDGITTADVTLPSADELYEELDVYASGTITDDQMVINEDALVSSISDKGLLEKVFGSVYADSTNVEWEFEPSRTTLDGFTEIKLKGTFDDAEVLVIHKFKYDYQAKAELRGSSYLIIDQEDYWSIELLGGEISGLDQLSLMDGFDDIFSKAKNDYLSLDGAIDSMNQEIQIFSANIPIASILCLNINLDYFSTLELQGGIGVGFKASNKTSHGIFYDADKGIRSYSKDPDLSLSVSANAIIKGNYFTGVRPSISFNIPAICELGVEVPIGPYLEVDGVMSLENKNGECVLSGAFDAYIALRAEADAYVVIPAFKLLDDVPDKITMEIFKRELIIVENKAKREIVSVGMSKEAVINNNILEIGAINVKYKNRLTDQIYEERLDEYKIAIDGVEYVPSDGVINAKFEEGIHPIILKWTYENNDYTYETEMAIHQKQISKTEIIESLYDIYSNVLDNIDSPGFNDLVGGGFKNLLDGYDKHAYGYFLSDINNDKLPELIIHNKEWDRAHLETLIISYDEKTNRLFSDSFCDDEDEYEFTSVQGSVDCSGLYEFVIKSGVRTDHCIGYINKWTIVDGVIRCVSTEQFNCPWGEIPNPTGVPQGIVLDSEWLMWESDYDDRTLLRNQINFYKEEVEKAE